jgi:hypothetical protein
MYEINFLMYYIVWRLLAHISQFSPYGKKVALDGSQINFF